MQSENDRVTVVGSGLWRSVLNARPVKSSLLRALSSYSLKFYRDGHFMLSLGPFHKFDHPHGKFFYS